MPSSGQLLPDCTTPPGLPQQTSRRACEGLRGAEGHVPADRPGTGSGQGLRQPRHRCPVKLLGSPFPSAGEHVSTAWGQKLRQEESGAR